MATGLLHHTAVSSIASRFTSFRKRTPGSRAVALSVAASLSAAAGLLHAAVIPSHLTDWPLSGAFFILVAAAQCVFAVALLRDPSGKVLSIGFLGTVGLLALYLVSRTIGIPFGPHPLEAEPIGITDLLSGAAELGLVLLLIHLAGGVPVPERAPLRRRGYLVRLSAALLLAAAGTATASPVAGHHGSEGQAHGAAFDEHLFEDEVHGFRDGRFHQGRRAHKGSREHRFERCSTPTGFAATLTAGTDARRALAFAYHDHDGNLWLHDIAANRTSKALAAPGCWFEEAQVRNDHSLSLAIEGKVWLLDLRTGSVERVKLPRWVSVHEWNPDGTQLAYLRWPDEGSGVDVWVRDMRTGKDRLVIELRREEMEMGCGGDGGGPQTSVHWSPDGSKLLVEFPFFSNEQVFALDSQTGEVVREVEGSYGMWLPDSEKIAVHHHADWEHMTWKVVGLTPDVDKTFEIGGWRERPVMSPDGKFLAYDDNERHASTYVLDLTTGVERRVSDAHAAPVWIDNRTLAANRLGLCRPYECGHYPWPQADAVDLIEIGGGEPMAIDATSSVHAAVLFPAATPATVDGAVVIAPTFEHRDDVQAYPLTKIRFGVRATDPDGSAITYSVRSLPRRATFDDRTGTFAWRPGLRDHGIHRVVFVATTARGRSAEQTVTITVRPFTDLLGIQ